MRYSSIGRLLAAFAAFAASPPALAQCSIQRYAELPVTMIDLRPTLTAAINGSERTFLLDSGAFFSVISPGTARDLGLKLEAPPYGLRMIGVGGDAEIRVATVKALSILGTTLPNVQFIVGGSEPGTAGVVGQNLLGEEVEYDLPHGTVRLFRTKSCQKTNLAYWLKDGDIFSAMDIADRAESGFHTVGTVKINDVSVRAMFDTGAGATILSLGAAARAGLKPTMPGAKPGGVEYGFGRKGISTWIVPVRTMAIGDERISNARVRIGDIGNSAEMLIGADFMISHRVFVSNTVHKLFMSYTGGPIFDLTAHAGGNTPPAPEKAVAPESPLDAAALSRRGAVAAAQHDGVRALADIGRAIALAPEEPRYLLQRARLHLDRDETALATADIDAAIKLKHDDVDARMIRAGLFLKDREAKRALEDLDAAAAAAGNAADERFALALLYQQAEALNPAMAQATLWIVNHPVDAKRPDALNARCWMRALSGKELAQALDDCNAALRLRPRTAPFLDSRGLVRLRMGESAKAIADYDAALSLDPKIGWSLYGRSLAKRSQGKIEAAKADRDAALAINPELPALAARYGIDR